MSYKFRSESIGVEFCFERVNVIVGANGTGKSKFLGEIRQNGFKVFGISKEKTVYIEGGRAISISGELALNRGNFEEFRSPALVEKARIGSLEQPLSKRIQNGLISLNVKSQAIKNKHSDDAEKWSSNGATGKYPQRPDLPIERLVQLFEEVFPRIALRFDDNTNKLSCSKDGSPHYDPSALSDGEKQVLAILVDVVLLAKEDSLIVVDEPELNLNAGLAVRLWHTIEQEMPKARFVYGTHSVSFAARDSVDYLVALSKDARNTLVSSQLHEMSAEERKDLLGIIPGILSHSTVLITEGDDSSFDNKFYRWLLNVKDVEIIPEGGGETVKAIVSRTGTWSKIAATVQIKGVVDRDYKCAEAIANINGEGVVVLDLHEAESYACIPKVICSVAEHLALVERCPTIADIEKLVLDHLETKKLKIAAQRVIHRSNARLSVSVERKILDSIRDVASLETAFKVAAEEQTNHALNKIGSEHVLKVLAEEIARIDSVLEKRDVMAALVLCPGKSLVVDAVKMTGARSVIDFLRAAIKHLDIASVSELDGLRNRLTALFVVNRDQPAASA